MGIESGYPDARPHIQWSEWFAALSQKVARCGSCEGMGGTFRPHQQHQAVREKVPCTDCKGNGWVAEH